MSADGRFVAFLGSLGDSPPRRYLRDRLGHTTTELSDSDDLEPVQPAISADGTTVAQAAVAARLGGADRYAAAVAATFGPGAPVVLASGVALPAALATAPRTAAISQAVAGAAAGDL